MQGYTYLLLSTHSEEMPLSMLFKRQVQLCIVSKLLIQVQAISGCYASAYVSPINASSVLGRSSDWLVDLSGNFATVPNDCADGSTFRGNGISELEKLVLG